MGGRRTGRNRTGGDAEVGSAGNGWIGNSGRWIDSAGGGIAKEGVAGGDGNGLA